MVMLPSEVPPDTPPPPDATHPWIWDERERSWFYVVTDTADGVPTSLQFSEVEKTAGPDPSLMTCADISRAAARAAPPWTDFEARMAFADQLSKAKTIQDVPLEWRDKIIDAWWDMLGVVRSGPTLEDIRRAGISLAAWGQAHDLVGGRQGRQSSTARSDQRDPMTSHVQTKHDLPRTTSASRARGRRICRLRSRRSSGATSNDVSSRRA